MRPPLFAMMARIVRASTDALRAYRADFWLHDQYTLLYATRPGDEFVWIVRDAGTELFRLYQGDSSVAVSYWLSPEHSCNRAYHVVCADTPGFGTVTPVTRERAVELARLPQRGPLRLTPREYQLVRHLTDLLRATGNAYDARVRRAQAFVDQLEFTGPVAESTLHHRPGALMHDLEAAHA